MVMLSDDLLDGVGIFDCVSYYGNGIKGFIGWYKIMS